MTQLKREDIVFTVNNYTPRRTNSVTPNFELIRKEDRDWYLISSPIQFNVNDPFHTAPGVVNLGRYVSANVSVKCPSSFSPLPIQHRFVGDCYTALIEGGAPHGDKFLIQRMLGFSVDYSAHERKLYFSATQDTYMGTFFMKFEVPIRELFGTDDDKLKQIDKFAGWDIRGTTKNVNLEFPTQDS